MKILRIVFGTVDVNRDNLEPRLSKLDKSLSLWKSRSLSLIGKVLILNILGLSKLLLVSRVLDPPRWVYDKLNRLIWPLLWGARLETMARKTIVCPTSEGGLGLKDFVCQGKALRLVALVNPLGESCHKCFYMAKYFCGARLAPLRSERSTLRDNLTPSAAQPTSFYVSVLSSLQSVNIPCTFLFSAKSLYPLFLKKAYTIPILPAFWSPFVSARFSLSRHWRLVRDDFTENFKNDLAWLITLRAIKVRRSLRDWGYIGSSRCASCPRDKTIDHCFLHCPRVKLVWFHFLPPPPP